MKVLVVDKFPSSSLEKLRSLGFDVAYNAELKGEALVAEVKQSGADALVVRSTKVTEPMLDGSRISLIVRAGSGVDNVDVQAASRRGIYVSNCPGKNASAVAELTLGLILALDRRIADNVIQLRDGKWNKKEFSIARGLQGRTLGVLGLGTIGQLVIKRAHAFGMHVVAWSRNATSERADTLGVEVRALPEDVAAASDVVSVHLPLTPETKGLCGPSFFQVMRPGAFFINTSRGEIVDELALKQAIQNKGIRAGLDVFHDEPATATGTFTNELGKLENLYGTHHIGASTEQAQDAIADETVRILREYRDTGRVPNVVNLSAQSPATHVLMVRHFDRVGVLAHVLTGLRGAGINVQEMENVVFANAGAAMARIHVAQAPSASVLDSIQQSNTDIMEMKLLSTARR